MKVHSTNYENVLIEVAEDCPANTGVVPPLRGNKKSVANLQYEMLNGHAYEYTSDDVLFAVFAQRQEIPEQELAASQAQFFSKGQPCFRASPLTKRFGWGVHSDAQGRVAIYGVESSKYQSLLHDVGVTKRKAMRSAKA